MQSVPSGARSVISVSSTGSVNILGGTAGSASRPAGAPRDQVLSEITAAFRDLFSASIPNSGISQGPSLFSSTARPANLGDIRSALDGVSQTLSSPPAGGPAQASSQASSQANAAPPADPDWPFPDLGPDPLMDRPTGSGPTGSFSFNPAYFPTKETSETIARMLGGKVVAQNALLTAPGSHFVQNQPNYMIEMPNGNIINPGFIAQAISVHQPRNTIDAMIYSEVNNIPIAPGQAPHFVPVNAAAPKLTSTSTSTSTPTFTPAPTPGSGTATAGWSSLDQMMTHAQRTLGSDPPPEDSAAVAAQQRMQLVQKMLQLVSRLASIQNAAQPETRGRRPVTT